MKTKLLIVLGCLLGCTAVGAVTGYGQNLAPPVYGVSGPMMPGANGALGYPPYGATAIQPGGSEDTQPFVSRYRLDIGYGDGLGWDDGYTSFGAFVPFSFNSDNGVLYIDARGFATYKTGSGLGEGGGGNVGLGYRHYVPTLNRFFGVSGWFDADGGHQEDFYRAGVSFESVGRALEFRANGYIPVDDSTRTVFSGFVNDPFFLQNLIILTHRNTTESQFGGFDAEIGGPLPTLAKYGISGYVGGYYITNDDIDRDSAGFQARGQANISDDLQAGVRVTHDDVFGTNVWGTVTFTFPRTSIMEWFRADVLRQPSVYSQMDRQVQRNYRIPILEKSFDTQVAAINPLDGQPFHVAHINPDAASDGNGFVETPYNNVNSFVNAADIDIIRILPGNAANLAGTGPFVLLDNQRLLSSAVEHTFTATQGTFTLPGFTGGALPVLTNGATTTFSSESMVVQLADNDEVSGFRIDGTSGSPGFFHDGIASQAGGITNGFNINRNEFVLVANGVNITHQGNGTGILDQNTATGFGFGALSGFSITHDTGGTLDLTVTSNTATGFLGEDVNGNDSLDFGESVNNDAILDEGAGFSLVATDATTVNATISNNTFSSNGTGLKMEANALATINATVEDNNITNNLDDNTGMNVTADNGTVTATLNRNQFLNNAGVQLQINALNAGTATFTLEENVFDRSNQGTVGLGIDAETGSTVDLTANTLNSFIGNGVSSGPGLLAQIDSSTFNLTMVGTTLATGNVFNNNAGAGIALELSGTAAATMDIQKNTITATVDDGIASPLNFYQGAGIFAVLFNTSTLTNSVIDGNVIGGSAATSNRDIGINIAPVDQSTISNILIGNEDGDNGNGNLISHNLGSGVEIDRQVDATVNNVRIVDNTIDSNEGHGISIVHAGTATDVGDFLIQDNVIQNQFGTLADGIRMFVKADGRVTVDIIDNLITGNEGSGIHAVEQTNTATDLRRVSGNWETNIITLNDQHGIALDANSSSLNVGALGVDADGKSRGNLIDQNGLDGVLIVGPGSSVFTNNTITRNGLLDGGSLLTGHGVDIEGPGFKNITLNDNIIRLNLGDGIEFNNNNFDIAFFFALTLNDNDVSFNDGRGLDFLNQGDAYTTIVADNNAFNGNSLEGVYIVNTSSTTQNQTDDSTDTLAANGAIDANPFIDLTFTDNDVLGNGVESGFSTTGFVLRVGTSGGGYTYTNPGGFASSAVGGVIADIQDNTFGGNQGDDVMFHSFVSTGDPAGTAGTWDDTTFQVDSYEGDPLARLDLTWIGNSYDSIDVNVVGAFYDNAEDTFKSRTDQATDPGPFSSATRRRNAERLGFRGTGVTIPLTPGGASDTFLYPGMGSSTFRLAIGSDTTGFLIDTSPYNDTGDANGEPFGGAIFGEQPFGWTSF